MVKMKKVGFDPAEIYRGTIEIYFGTRESL